MIKIFYFDRVSSHDLELEVDFSVFAGELGIERVYVLSPELEEKELEEIEERMLESEDIYLSVIEALENEAEENEMERQLSLKEEGKEYPF